MWIIKMKFVGKDGTYTIQEESATDEACADIKYNRMLKNWHNILCHDVIGKELYGGGDYSIYLKIINFQLSLLNDGSTFEISKMEIN